MHGQQNIKKILDLSVLKMEEARTSETSVTLYKTPDVISKTLWMLNRVATPNIAQVDLLKHMVYVTENNFGVIILHFG